MDNILYQIFKIILNMYLKHREKTENPPVRIYVNKTENMITFKIKTVYYVELLMPEITKDENSENVPRFEITKVVLMHCTIIKNDFEHDLRII